MPAVLIYLLVTGFVIVPATVIYAAVLLVMGLFHGNPGAYFTLIHVRILTGAGLAIALAFVLFVAFGKRLVVK
jgi:hypothetical protein